MSGDLKSPDPLPEDLKLLCQRVAAVSQQKLPAQRKKAILSALRQVAPPPKPQR